jgi:phosphoglycerate dehydrogenase-like enzyme
VQREPRIRLDLEADLLPPKRHAADFGGDPAFRRTPDQQRRFAELIDRADALYGIPDLDAAQLARAVRSNPRLRWVHTMAAGGGAQVRAAGLSAGQLERVAFTTSAGVHAGPLTEFALFGVLAGAKDLPRLREQQARHAWSGRWEMRQVSELTVLVVGLGGIGVRVARQLRALGARVIGCSKTRRAEAEVDRWVPTAELASVVGEVDAIVLSLPETGATVNLVDDALLAGVRPATILVNVGRGSVIDETALLRALRDGRIGFAALDVFATEPLSAHSPLWDEPGVVVSPHTAALSSSEDRLIAELFADNATRLLDGSELRNKVDTVDFY